MQLRDGAVETPNQRINVNKKIRDKGFETASLGEAIVPNLSESSQVFVFFGTRSACGLSLRGA